MTYSMCIAFKLYPSHYKIPYECLKHRDRISEREDHNTQNRRQKIKNTKRKIETGRSQTRKATTEIWLSRHTETNRQARVSIDRVIQTH